MKKSLVLLIFVSTSLVLISQRTETNFNNNWKFILEDDTSFSKEKVDISNWKNLNIPHDWSFEKGVRKGGDQGQGGGYHDGGIGWYRKSFIVEKNSLTNVTYVNFRP